MRAVQILVAAVLFGLLGGYAWSALQVRPSHLHIPKAVGPKAFEVPQDASDKEWAARSLGKRAPEVDGARVDPTAVEQSVHYANCDEVRAAGKAPLYVGEPGYRPELDRDSDGVACEPYRRM